MLRVLIVFVGGGAGACLRALLLAGLGSWGSTSPVLLANLVGSFLLGVVYVLADEAGLLGTRARHFLAVGVLGGFTTFSTFGWGADLLVAQGQASAAFAYLAGSVGGGVLAVIGGLLAGRELIGLFKPGLLAARHHPRSARADLAAIEAEDRKPAG
ncbi:MAG: fluoride efflux transporter FluC [Chloroflexota bacterium]